MLWWYWEHVRRTQTYVDALCPALFADRRSPSVWQWFMLMALDAPLVASLLVTVLALHPRTRGLFSVTLAQALYVNSLLLYVWSLLLPGIRATDDDGVAPCRHEVRDRPCEEAAILSLVLVYTAIYDGTRARALHYTSLQLAFKWTMLVFMGLFGSWAQASLGFFHPVEVLAGVAIGAATAVLAALWTLFVLLPMAADPVAKSSSCCFRYANVPANRE